MRKTLGLLGTILIPLCNPQYSNSQTSDFYEKSISREEPADVAREVIDRREIEKRDLVNIISLSNKNASKEEYSQGGLVGGFVSALEDEICEDPFFYVWENYSRDDYIIKNQTINAGWKTLAANYPNVFRKIKDAVAGIKKVTTIDKEIAGGCRVKINPELTANDRLRLKARFENGFLDNWQIKIGEDKIEVGKIYYLSRHSKNATFETDITSKYSGEYCLRATFKFPLWFN